VKEEEKKEEEAKEDGDEEEVGRARGKREGSEKRRQECFRGRLARRHDDSSGGAEGINANTLAMGSKSKAVLALHHGIACCVGGHVRGKERIHQKGRRCI